MKTRVTLRHGWRLVLLAGAAAACAPSPGGPVDSGEQALGDAGPGRDAGPRPDAGQRADSGTAPDAGVPTLGWRELVGTSLEPLCPSYPDIQGTEGCKAVISSWSSAWADTRRNHLLLWGGGHTDYFGNEVYLVDLGATPPAISLAHDATHGASMNAASCPDDAYADGTPTSRHTNDGLVYAGGAADLLFAHGGNLANCGSFTAGTWKLDPVTFQWTRYPRNSPYPPADGSGDSDAYDPVSALIYSIQPNAGTFWSWDPATGVWTLLSNSAGCDDGSPAGYGHTAAVDPIRRLFLCVGAATGWKTALDAPYASTKLTMSGCDGLIAPEGPGFAYDDSQGKFVGWAGGDTVYTYDPDADSCSTTNWPGGPPAPSSGADSNGQQSTGTYKRFSYFPALGGFAAVNSWDQNVFFLRVR